MSAEGISLQHTSEIALSPEGFLDIPVDAYVVGNIGAGTTKGMLHNVFSRRSFDTAYIVDVDFDAVTVAELQSDNRAHERKHAVVVQASADAIPVRDETFDELYVFNVVGDGLNSMRGSDVGQTAFVEMLQKVKEGGTVYIGECDTPEVAVRNLQQISVDAVPWQITVEVLQSDALTSRLGLLGMHVFEKAKYMEKRVLETGDVHLLGSVNAMQPYNPFLLVITKGQPRKKSA